MMAECVPGEKQQHEWQRLQLNKVIYLPKIY